MAIPAERAGAFRRIGALSVDWAIASFTTALFYPLQASSLEPTLVRLGIFVFEVGILTSFGGTSIGKRIFGIRVVTFPDYFYIRPKAAFLRVFLVALVLPALFTDSEGRGFHERISKTTVIRIKN